MVLAKPAVPAVKTFVDAISPVIGKKPTARHWMAYVSLHAARLAAEAAKSLDGLKMAHALGGSAAAAGSVADVRRHPLSRRRSSADEQHLRRPDASAGRRSRRDLFKVEATVTGEQAAGSVANTGCKMRLPELN